MPLASQFTKYHGRDIVNIQLFAKIMKMPLAFYFAKYDKIRKEYDR